MRLAGTAIRCGPNLRANLADIEDSMQGHGMENYFPTDIWHQRFAAYQACQGKDGQRGWLDLFDERLSRNGRLHSAEVAMNTLVLAKVDPNQVHVVRAA